MVLNFCIIRKKQIIKAPPIIKENTANITDTIPGLEGVINSNIPYPIVSIMAKPMKNKWNVLRDIIQLEPGQ